MPQPEHLTEFFSLEQVLEWLPSHIAVDFGCPDRGPHEWTSASLPNVLNQWFRHCNAKKPIPGRRLPEGRGWWTY